MARQRRDLDRFAGEGIGHIDGLPAGMRDAIAEMADMVDLDTFNHGARR